MQQSDSQPQKSVVKLNVQSNDPLRSPQSVQSSGEIQRQSSARRPERMDFRRWIVGFFAIANLLFSPILCYLGYQARSYGLAKIVVDKALILIGSLLLIVSVITLIATIKLKKRWLISILYSYLVLVVFLSIFVLGIFSFTPDLQDYYHKNWTDAPSDIAKADFNQFQRKLESDITFLGVFSATILGGISLSVVFIIRLVTLEKIMKSILPPLNLLLMVLSLSLMMTGIYSTKNVRYIPPLPNWTNIMTICVGIIVFLVGGLGYYASVKSGKTILKLYVVVLGVVCALALAAAIGYFVLAQQVDKIVQTEWPAISKNLDALGHHVRQNSFLEYVKTTMKFAGLYGLTFAVFLLITVLVSLHKISQLNN